MKSKQSKLSQYFVFLKSLTNNWIMLKTDLDNSKDDIVFDNSLTEISATCILMHTGLFITSSLVLETENGSDLTLLLVRFQQINFPTRILMSNWPGDTPARERVLAHLSLRPRSPFPTHFSYLNNLYSPPFLHTLDICNCAVYMLKEINQLMKVGK